MENQNNHAAPWLDPTKRHDAVLLFDVTNGNPNGDPDNDNQPRVNWQNNLGLVTDVAIKRKIRNYIAAARPADNGVDDPSANNARYKIYVEVQSALNGRHRRAYTALGLESSKKTTSRESQLAAQRWMCDNFFDVRMFGAVMATGDYNCGQLKGPFQVSFASSVDPIDILPQTITRVAVTKEEELAKMFSNDNGEKGGRGKDREMGSKAIVPYGLYRAHVYYSPRFGSHTGVSTEDLELFWKALQMMWDLDRSAARADMSCRGVYVFSHDNPLGDAPADKLLSQIDIKKKSDVEYPARFSDYEVATPEPGVVLPGVTFSGNLA
ncbi:MAG: type I-C CRISPR-associated protein Cas7/Csd2 [Ferrimicrobium acidiphilum]